MQVLPIQYQVVYCIVFGIGLIATSIEPDMTQLSRAGINWYFEPCSLEFIKYLKPKIARYDIKFPLNKLFYH